MQGRLEAMACFVCYAHRSGCLLEKHINELDRSLRDIASCRGILIHALSELGSEMIQRSLYSRNIKK